MGVTGMIGFMNIAILSYPPTKNSMVILSPGMPTLSPKLSQNNRKRKMRYRNQHARSRAPVPLTSRKSPSKRQQNSWPKHLKKVQIFAHKLFAFFFHTMSRFDV